MNAQKQVIQPSAIIHHEAEEEIPGLPNVKRGRPFFTLEQIKERNRAIDAFCEEKGIDFKHHSALHRFSLKNLEKIVAKCEEENIPFRPYADFLTYAFRSFSKSINTLEEHGIDPAKNTQALSFPTLNLSKNLRISEENERDPVKEKIIQFLDMKPEKFQEFIKTYVPFEHSTEEREKRVVELLVKIGFDEKEINGHVKNKSPKTVERIIETCERHDFKLDKTKQSIFELGPGALESKFELCERNGVKPSELAVSQLALSNEFGRNLLDIVRKT